LADGGVDPESRFASNASKTLGADDLKTVDLCA